MMKGSAWTVFLIVCMLVGFALFSRFWALLPVYVDRATRAQVERALRVTAESRGWLLSDLTIVHLDRDHVFLRHRFHQRKRYPMSCVRVTLSDLSSIPCSES